MEVRCLRHPRGTSIVRPFLANQTMNPHAEGETGAHHTRFPLKVVLPCKTMLTLISMAVTASHIRLSQGALGVLFLMHAHIKTPLTTTGMQALFLINSIKLHLTFKFCCLLICTFTFSAIRQSGFFLVSTKCRLQTR